MATTYRYLGCCFSDRTISLACWRGTICISTDRLDSHVTSGSHYRWDEREFWIYLGVQQLFRFQKCASANIPLINSPAQRGRILLKDRNPCLYHSFQNYSNWVQLCFTRFLWFFSDVQMLSLSTQMFAVCGYYSNAESSKKKYINKKIMGEATREAFA